MAIQVMSMTLSVSALGTITLTLGLVLLLLLCMPCLRKRKGFSTFSNSIASLDVEHGEVNSSFTLTTDGHGISSSQSGETVSIDPLPDLTSRVIPFSTPLRPKIGGVGRASHDASIRLTAYHPFPRNQIVYLKELGTGWFGKAIESDAERIIVGIPRSKVVIKMLKDDATREEKTHFFEEVAPYRMMEHTNVMRILGHCTETSPSLVILEAAAYGNLKQFLCSHRHSEALLIQRNRLIQFSLDLSCGLACLHRHDYLHRDLAARNCLVMSDYTLKIGDYGIADHLYKEDYIACGSDLLPLRWMAPETLKQENGYWALNSFSKDSDIWALGVVLWEIATLGEWPYAALSDEEVLDQVVTNRELQLPEPHLPIPYKDRLYDLMRCCWAGSSQRIELEQVHGLLQAIACMTDEDASGDTDTSQFDAKWAQLIPNQHHWSADSIDGHLASTGRGDTGCISELSLSDSLEELSGQELSQENALHTKAIVHSSAVAISLDAQNGVESRVGPFSFPVLEKDACPISVSSVAAEAVSATFPSKSSPVPVEHTNNKPVPDRNEAEVFAAGIGLTMNGQVLSGSENSSSGFDVLESTADFDLVDGKSVSDSIGTCQSSLTGDASIDKDSSSCEFVVISEFKESAVSPPNTDLSVFNGSLSPSEKFALSKSSHSTTSHNDKTSDMAETFKPPQEDIDSLQCSGTELSSKGSLDVQAHSIDSSGEHPSLCTGTGFSSSDSFTVPNPELHNASHITEQKSPHASDSMCTYLSDDSDFQFDGTLGFCSGSDSLTTVTSTFQSVSSENLTTVANAQDSASFDSLTTVTSLIGSRGSDSLTAVTSLGPRGSNSLTTVTSLIGLKGSDSLTSVTSVHDSVGSNSLTTVTSLLTSSPENITVEEFDEEEFLSSEPTFEKIEGADSEKTCSATWREGDSIPQSSGMEKGESDHENSASESNDVTLYEETNHIPQTTLTPAVRSDPECLGATGVTSTNAESPTDSDTSTNSDSGKDYICQESWEEEGEDSPPPASPSSMDSEEYALMIASEIYLSKGLKNSRPFESTYLEPIPEDPIPSVSEESVAPAPSESSSVDVKFDEVFEWDDFMGDQLVEAAHSPEAGSSPKESFDMSEWMLDMESDDMPGAVGSLAAQHSDHLHKHTGAASDTKSTAVAADSIVNRPSATSDNESASHGSRARTHRSYISDLLSNRTKGSTSSSSHALRGSSKFYSLYEEEFDLESDSQSEGGNSPPGSGSFQSDSCFAQKGAGTSSSHAPLNQSASNPGADTGTSYASSKDHWTDGQGVRSFDDWEDSDEFALD